MFWVVSPVPGYILVLVVFLLQVHRTILPQAVLLHCFIVILVYTHTKYITRWTIHKNAVLLHRRYTCAHTACFRQYCFSSFRVLSHAAVPGTAARGLLYWFYSYLLQIPHFNRFTHDSNASLCPPNLSPTSSTTYFVPSAAKYFVPRILPQSIICESTKHTCRSQLFLSAVSGIAVERFCGVSTATSNRNCFSSLS